MNTVSSDIDIDLPIRTVYNQWTQFEDFPAFMGGVEEVKQVDETTLNWRVTVAGVERDFLAKITEQLPDERVAWNSISGPSHAGVVTFHRLDENKTRVRLQFDWEPEGLVEKAGALLQLDDAQVAKDLKEFARLLESNGFESGAWRGSVDRPSDGSAV
ncbi:SRPBCC family protein [Leucobacter sp. NPDC077196]|uniref:SRPBCC family protein n=1 Tax=Leucobacter sp. NPDC077196 TaxID=3154959 RepID=UPI003445BF33